MRPIDRRCTRDRLRNAGLITSDKSPHPRKSRDIASQGGAEMTPQPIAFAYATPAPGDVETLTFSCVNTIENVKINVTANAAVNTLAIDTSAGDVTTTVPVDRVDFAIEDECGLRVATLSIQRETIVDFSTAQRVSAAVRDRCQSLADHLFSVGFTFTSYQCETS